MRVFLLIFSVYYFSGCTGNDQYNAGIRTADSLSGALSIAVKELQDPDSVTLSRYLTRYEHYSQFITQNVVDTISRREADALQMFITAGETLKDFRVNRRMLVEHSAVLQKQLDVLNHDLVHKVIPGDQGRQAVLQEKQEVERTITHIMQERSAAILSVQNLRNSVNQVEQIIRSRNKGDLPLIIKDSIPF